LRDFNQGYIWEEGGQISAFILYSRAGSGGDQWSIEALATHPEFRRKGLARRLLMEALTDLRRRDGKICTLKVRDTNDAAYALYRDLGFIHFDTAVYLRNDSLRPALPRVDKRYRVEDVGPRGWFSSWRQRGELACRTQPRQAKQLFAVSPSQFQRPWVAPALAPLLTKMSGHRRHHSLVWHDGRLVATLAVDEVLRGPDPHEIEILADVDSEPTLAPALVDLASLRLAHAVPAPVLTEARDSSALLLNALESRGFRRVITWHELGMRL
jgi:predicted GNAT family acetyltransferase